MEKMKISLNRDMIEVFLKQKITNSLGLSVFCTSDQRGIRAEIARVKKDIEIMKIIKRTDLPSYLTVLKESTNIYEAEIQLTRKFGFSHDVVKGLLEIDLSKVIGDDIDIYVNRLKAYESLLESFIDSTNT